LFAVFEQAVTCDCVEAHDVQAVHVTVPEVAEPVYE
jgi:hypothetical protein